MNSHRAHGEFLFHGTRYGSHIIGSDRLIPASIGNCKVCLTSDFSVANYWARIPRRDKDEDDQGTILVLDRRSLELNYTLKPHIDLAWGGEDEHEFAVWSSSIAPVSQYLVAQVPVFGRPNVRPKPVGRYLAHAIGPKKQRRFDVAVRNGDNTEIVTSMTAGEALQLGMDLIRAGGEGLKAAK